MSDETADSPSEEFLRAAARAPALSPPPAEPDLVGQSIGRFRVLSRLGQGGMGIVYRAKDSVLGREVALKVLPQEVARDPSRRRRFLKEARLAAAIAHPNLVAIYDVGDTDDRLYLAMELIDGESLRAKLSSGPVALAQVIRIGTDMARGIARAHAAGIVHRDLKPENVMVAADGTVKILDFGIATIRASAADGMTPTESGSESDSGFVVGTPSYMSPEQAKLRDITDKSDCFALGVVLYEMSTGRRPFTGASPVEVFIAIDRDEPEPIQAVQQNVPDALADLVMRCLDKAPERRPSADDITRGLSSIDTARAPGIPTRPTGRRPLIGLYAAAMGLAAAGLVAALVVERDPGPARARNQQTGSAAISSGRPPDPPGTAARSAVVTAVAVSTTATASASGSPTSAGTPRATAVKTSAPTAAPQPSTMHAAPSTSNVRDPLADPI